MRILKKELLVMWLAIAVIALMCLRPPWSYHYKPIREHAFAVRGYTKVKYTWIWAETPRPELEGTHFYECAGGKLDTTRLIIQCFVVALLAGGVIVSLRAKRPDA